MRVAGNLNNILDLEDAGEIPLLFRLQPVVSFRNF